MESNAFGKKLKELREQHGETQKELAEFLSLGVKQVQRYEQGKPVPEMRILHMLAAHYDYDFFSILSGFPMDVNREKRIAEILQLRALSRSLVDQVAKLMSSVYDRDVASCMDELEQNTSLNLRELLKEQ